MNEKEIAAILDGMAYGADLPAASVLDAKRNGIAIVFGASHDLMEFRGAVEGEVVCDGGGIAYLNKNGIVQNDQVGISHKVIRAIWGSEGYAWIYKTDIRHETFDILERGQKYCRGIVFSMEDLE